MRVDGQINLIIGLTSRMIGGATTAPGITSGSDLAPLRAESWLFLVRKIPRSATFAVRVEGLLLAVNEAGGTTPQK